MSFKEVIGKFWKFLNEDTWQSWIVSLFLIIGLIYFVFFPTLSFVTSSSLPLVVVESCSMYHGTSFDDWWFRSSDWYESRGVTDSDFRKFSLKNGLNKGDIIFVWGRGDYKLGDIIIFEPNPEAIAPHPIIHRIVSLNPTATKGDHNPSQLTLDQRNRIDETNIPNEKIIGRAAFRIPVLGWVKLMFFELRKDLFGERRPGDAWFCK